MAEATMSGYPLTLFTKRFPESLFRFIVGVSRWQLRANAYTNLMCDEYPPFSMDA